jgi:hypothetical protein
MTYIIVSIANAGGAPEQAYRKLQSAGACPDRPYAGTPPPFFPLGFACLVA